jgi:apurinic endonuclease APN1
MSQVGGCVVIPEISGLLGYLNGYPLTTLQFSVNPSIISSKSTDLSKSRALAIKTQNVFLIMHGKYVYNFCRQDVMNQIDSLVKEITWASQLGCNVIIHQGKNIVSEKMSKIEAINNYVRNVSDVIEQTYDTETMVLLENSAAQGTEIGFKLEEIAYIYNQFDDHIKQRIGICIDTCHIFVAGELDIRKKVQVVEFFNKFDHLIGLDKLKVIHFNDSGIPFAGKRDLHGDLMGGYITNHLLGGSTEGMQYISQVAKERKIPLILETPCTISETITEQPSLQYRIVQAWIDQSSLSQRDAELVCSVEQLTFDYYQSKKIKSYKQ